MQKHILSLSFLLIVAQAFASDDEIFMRGIAVEQGNQWEFKHDGRQERAHQSYTGHMAIEQYKDQYPQVYVQHKCQVTHEASNVSANEQDYITELYSYVRRGSPNLIEVLQELSELNSDLKVDIMHAVVPRISFLSYAHGGPESPITLVQLAALLAYESDYIYRMFQHKQKEIRRPSCFQGACVGLVAGGLLGSLLGANSPVIGSMAGAAVAGGAVRILQKYSEQKGKRIEKLTQNYLRNAQAFAQHSAYFLNGHHKTEVKSILDRMKLKSEGNYQPAPAYMIVNGESQYQEMATLTSAEEEDASQQSILPPVKCWEGYHPLFVWLKQEGETAKIVYPEYTPRGDKLNPDFEDSELCRIQRNCEVSVDEDEIYTGKLTQESIENAVRTGNVFATLPRARFVRVPLHRKHDRFALIPNPVEMWVELARDDSYARKFINNNNRRESSKEVADLLAEYDDGDNTIVICGNAQFFLPNTNQGYDNPAEWQEIPADKYRNETRECNYYKKYKNLNRSLGTPVERKYYQQRKLLK